MRAALMQAWFLDSRTLIFAKPRKHRQDSASLVSKITYADVCVH